MDIFIKSEKSILVNETDVITANPVMKQLALNRPETYKFHPFVSSISQTYWNLGLGTVSNVGQLRIGKP